MNILYINHYAGAPKYGMEFRPYYLSKEWVKKGHNVVIVASAYSHVRSKNPDVKRGVNLEIIDNIIYIWFKTLKYKGNGLNRVLNMLNFVFLLFRYSNQLIKKYNPDIIIASSTYPLDIFPAYFMKKIKKSKLIFEVHDLWPLTPIEIGGYPRWHPFILLMQIAEIFAYKNSDYVVSILPNAYEYMKNHGLPYNKYFHIPNGISLKDWQERNEEAPKMHKELIENLKKKGKFIVGYLGAHGRVNALDILLDAANLLNESKNLAIILIGDGPEKIKLMKKAELYKLENIYFLPPVPKCAVPRIMGMMDALYIGFKNVPLYRYGVSPNKLYDYLMSGRPIIQSISAGNDIVKEAKCGISVPAEDSRQIAIAINKLISMTKEEREVLGANGRNYVLKHNTYEMLASRYEELFY